MKTLTKQHNHLMILFENLAMKTKTKTNIEEDSHGGSEVKPVAAVVLYSRFGFLVSLLNLEKSMRWPQPSVYKSFGSFTD